MSEGFLKLLMAMNPAVAIPVGLVVLLGWVLGYPAVRARRDGVVSQEQARKARAEAEEEAAEADSKQFRREDSATDIFEARWKRAVTEADDERAKRIEAVELVKAARDDVHTAAQKYQVQLSAVEATAKAEILRISNSCEARIFAIETQHEQEVADLNARLDAQEEVQGELRRQNEQCERSNAALRREIDELRKWQQRSDFMGGK